MITPLSVVKQNNNEATDNNYLQHNNTILK